jgi:hypothetical protein
VRGVWFNFYWGAVPVKIEVGCGAHRQSPFWLLEERMLFVGFPLSYENACKMFGTPEEDGKILTDKVEAAGLKFEFVDKNVWVLGLRIKEFYNFAGQYSTTDDCITLIIKYKLKFIELIRATGVDISGLEIEHMEAEPVFVNNPQPYVVSF